MSNGVLLGIDIGTTATKIVVIDLNGSLLADISLPSELISLHSGWAEEDANLWWKNVQQGIPMVMHQAGIDNSYVLAVGVSGMVPALVMLDENKKPLRNSIQQNDVRAYHEVEYLQSKTSSEEILSRTGSAITQQSIGPKLLWLAANETEVLQNTKWAMGSYDFINFNLTGIPTSENNWALESGLYDLREKDWDDDLLSLCGINRSQLPVIRQSHEVIGYVTSEAAQATGLLKGTPVVAGSADHVASAFSSGVCNNGDLLVKLGGSGDVLLSRDHIEVDSRLFLDYHVIPGLYIINGCMAASGSIIKWYQRNFAPSATYRELDKEAEAIPAGSNGLIVLPYFLGEKTPIFDPHARGIIFGLTLQHNRAHVYRAVLEGISYGFLHHLEIFSELGYDITRVRVSNGGANSELWRQVTADVLGLPLEYIHRHPGSSLGAAYVAGMGIGAFKDWSEIERYIRVKGITQPNTGSHEYYLRQFQHYRTLYLNNKQLYRDYSPDMSPACDEDLP